MTKAERRAIRAESHDRAPMTLDISPKLRNLARLVLHPAQPFRP